ncbi:hypothetical protein OAM56_09355, partial [Alphaproteobacteria bacterium]|nr:hypothetical protein [Alphaproteobacteria bacterium]
NFNCAATQVANFSSSKIFIPLKDKKKYRYITIINIKKNCFYELMSYNNEIVTLYINPKYDYKSKTENRITFDMFESSPLDISGIQSFSYKCQALVSVKDLMFTKKNDPKKYIHIPYLEKILEPTNLFFMKPIRIERNLINVRKKIKSVIENSNPRYVNKHINILSSVLVENVSDNFLYVTKKKSKYKDTIYPYKEKIKQTLVLKTLHKSHDLLPGKTVNMILYIKENIKIVNINILESQFKYSGIPYLKKLRTNFFHITPELYEYNIDYQKDLLDWRKIEAKASYTFSIKNTSKDSIKIIGINIFLQGENIHSVSNPLFSYTIKFFSDNEIVPINYKYKLESLY